MAEPSKWHTDTSQGHSQWYVDRFRTMAANGVDLAGEARLVDAMTERGAWILDAGCGPGRVGAELARRGHHVVGVDSDEILIAAAEEDHSGPTWIVADLSDFDLTTLGQPQRFDAVVVAGNVMTFLASGTTVTVLANLRQHLSLDGFIIVGFGTDRGYPVAQFDADLTAAGLVVEHRFRTWDLKPWEGDAQFCVTVLRNAA